MDGQRNVYLFETFVGVADFGGVQVTNFLRYETVSLAKFDPAGNVLWSARSGRFK